MSGIILEFKTREDGKNTYCGEGTKLIHRFADRRNKTGHYPVFVYLAYIPQSKYRGRYKIGKAEHTKITWDDFDLDEIHKELMNYLYNRLKKYHPGKGKFEAKYDGAQFVHAIRVACGEGAEKQPQYLFKKHGKFYENEVFKLSKEDIEIFKNAKGSLLGRPIKHLTAKDFAKYLLEEKALSKNAIQEWISSVSDN